MNHTNYSKITFVMKQWRGSKRRIIMLRRSFGTDAQPRAKTKEKWNSVVGLEIHAQILSNSKLFSGSSTKYTSPVNSNVSFFDCASPGTLPVLNKRCVEAGILTALALSCKINEVSLFDRKHYFYADLPAGYQITQQRQPLAVDGQLNFQVYTPGVHRQPYSKVSNIKQLQLEQDSGKSLHDSMARRSLVDLNRAGVPLMELVFEPDLSDGEEAAALVKEIMLILQRLGTCSCKMEEGALRVDANISVNKHGEKLGTRTEVKNIGSIRSVAAAIKYEINRQIEEIEHGGSIVNETRAWDMQIRKTVPMRDKEEKQDYRYMPEPNLPPLHVHVSQSRENKYGLVDVPLLAKSLPKLPEELRTDLKHNFGLNSSMAFMLVNENRLLRLFKSIVEENDKRDPKIVSNILMNDLLKLVNKRVLELDTWYGNHACYRKLIITLTGCEIHTDGNDKKMELQYIIEQRALFNFNVSKFNEKYLGELVDMLQNKTINLITARKVLEACVADPPVSPRKIVEENNWTQISDREELTRICQNVLEQQSDAVKQYKSGKKKVFQFFVGTVAQCTENRADMAAVVDILKKLLDE